MKNDGKAGLRNLAGNLELGKVMPFDVNVSSSDSGSMVLECRHILSTSVAGELSMSKGRPVDKSLLQTTVKGHLEIYSRIHR